jgi:benzodiazapine receptor
MKRFLQLANILAFLFALTANALAAMQSVGGASIKDVSDKYVTFLTPATYAFSIWGLIYLLLLGFVLYQARDFFALNEKNELPKKLSGWFIVSSLANGFWTLFFVHEMILASLLTLMILTVSLYVIIGRLKIALEDNEVKRIVFIWWPILFYAGWVTVALIVNAASYLNYLGEAVSPFATLLALTILAVCLLILLVKRNVRELLVASTWGIVAIGVARMAGPMQNDTVAAGAFILSAVLLVACGIHAYANRKSLL